MNKLIPEYKKIKIANCIAVGGMIASGKSSLIRGLEQAIPNSKATYELASENGDTERAKLDDLLLYGLYNGTINPALFQLSFFLNRFEKYKESLKDNEGKLMLFDRTIFEDRLFAHQNMTNQPIIFTYYDQMWKDSINELIHLVGIPKLYVFLDMSWKTFKERIFQRNRAVEIDNFEENEQYFKILLDNYREFMIGIFKTYSINYVIVNVDNLEKEEVLERVLEVIKENK